MAPSQEVNITPPDGNLRKKIGLQVALENIFTPERIRACQKIVDMAYRDLFKEIQEGISDMEQDYKHVMRHPDDAGACLQHLDQLSETIRRRMENLGLAFGAGISQSLHDYVGSLPVYHPEDENIALVLRKHIDVLQARFKNGMTAGDGAMEQQILDSLDALVRKVRR